MKGKREYKYVPKAIKEMKPIVKISKRGNRYTMWTPAWYEQAVRGALRQLYFQWPIRKLVLDRVRLEEPKILKSGPRKGKVSSRPTVWHVCENCSKKCKLTVSEKNPNNYSRIWVDHKDPVVPGGRELSTDEFAERLFCDISNMWALCDACHRSKTKADRVTQTATPSWRRS